MQEFAATEAIYDVAIIGGGPAGMAAGIYTGRGRLRTLVLDAMGGGGQVNIIDQVENYPGVVGLETGVDLAEVMRKQMESFGVSVTFDQVERVEAEDDRIRIFGSRTYLAKTLLVASGARHRPLKVPGEGRLMGRGVSVCATCDGPFFKGKRVAVVGGGDSAVMEAVYLTRLVKHVTMIHRRDHLRAEKLLQERAMAAQNLDFVWDTVVEKILGEDSVQGLALKNIKTGQTSTLDVEAVFVFIGVLPNTDFLQGVVELDSAGFVKIHDQVKTSHPLIFAAGDVRDQSVRQIGAAVGDGIVAAVKIQEMLDIVTPERKHEKIA